MKVTILTDLMNDDIKEQFINTMWVAARTCYSADSPSHLLCEAANKLTLNDKIKLIQQVLRSGHHSICEHINITFAVEGVSRNFSHQAVRHRLCTYSQQSMRYTDFTKGGFDYVTPPAIEKNEQLNKEYHLIMEQLKNFYDRAVAAGIKPEDARFALPNASCTNLTITTNLRNLIHIMGLRCCTRAQWEIREVYRELASSLKYYFPWMSEWFGPNCEQTGVCPEGKLCCGKAPSHKEMLEALEEYKENHKNDKA